MNYKQLFNLLMPLLSSCAQPSLSAQPSSSGMIAYFKLDGNTTNYGSANISATAIGADYAANSVGQSASALQFAGSVNSYLNIADNSNLDFGTGNNFTVSLSFYFNATDIASGLLDNCLNYGGWGVWIWQPSAGNCNIQFNFRNASIGNSATTHFSAGAWHHVACVRNNGLLSIYIDGIFKLSGNEGTSSPSYPLNTFGGALGFSSYSPPRYNPLNGKIDEMRIYNRALSAAEIAVMAPYALPLKLSSFAALVNLSGVQLNWKTVMEENTSHFDIERSGDGIRYQFIGRQAAAGHSSMERQYNYADRTAPIAKNFYRLKMVDLDGTFTYSRIVVVNNMDGLLAMQVFPNPVKDVLQVMIPGQKKESAMIKITDMSGKTVYAGPLSLSPGNNSESIVLPMMSPGSYCLLVDKASGRLVRQFQKA